VDRLLYFVAPISILTAALAIFAVIPFGSVLPAGFLTERPDERIELVVAPGLDVGMLYVFALSSVAVYGVLLGGWASNNKYSFLGGLRSSAQLIAYEVPLGLGLLGVVLATGSLRLDTVIQSQAQGLWNVLAQPLGFMVFAVAATAEAARVPFDLPEAEQELIGGYHTEYSGIKLLMYLIAEFLHMVTAAVLIVVLFLGGWHFWGLTGTVDDVTWFQAIARILVFQAKVLLVVFVFMWVRWTLPRFRFDQLMNLAWKVMLPLGLVNLVTVAVLVEYEPALEQTLDGLARPATVAIAWTTALLAWLVAGLAAPLASDNRPRVEPYSVPLSAPADRPKRVGTT
jgi:NADH-quinone oxidoreductase subunit H